MSIKISITYLLKWFLMIFLILNCHSVYESGSVDFHFDILVVIISGILFLCIATKIRRFHVKFIFLFLIYQLPIVIYAFLIGDYFYTYIFKYVFFFLIIYIIMASNNDFINEMLEIYIKIIVLISLVSLFFYLFATILHVIQPTGTYYLEWAPARWINNFYGIYFEVSGGRVFTYKNAAIFSESPIFAALICLATASELFFCKKVNIKRVILLYVTLLSTFSTTGYIFIVISVCGIVYSNYDKFKQNRLFKVLFVILEIIVFMVTFIVVLQLLFNKKNAIGESFLVRSDDFLVALRIIAKHPIMGIGFGNISTQLDYMSAKRIATGNFGQSSDFAALLMSGGLYFMFSYLFGFIGIYRHNSKRRGLMLIGCYIYIFLVSRVGSTLFFLTLISCGLCSFIKTTVGEKKIS